MSTLQLHFEEANTIIKIYSQDFTNLLFYLMTGNFIHTVVNYAINLLEKYSKPTLKTQTPWLKKESVSVFRLTCWCDF